MVRKTPFVEARKQAEIRTTAIMRKLDALHEPDMFAGGWHNVDQEIKRAGRADINSSIGAS